MEAPKVAWDRIGKFILKRDRSRFNSGHRSLQAAAADTRAR